jgi:serine/threonine-protein kinase RsbT
MDVLSRHVAVLNARGILARTARRNGFEAERMGPEELQRILPDLERSLGLFCDPSRRQGLMAELASLSGSTEEVRGVEIPVTAEPDISAARTAARSVCQALGARPIIIQRVCTMVSELARNIVSYSEGGQIALTPLHDEPRRVTILAEDRGPGIPNLESILAGRYRSRTGMGMGLLGTKRLAERFHIDTGRDGTRVSAEVWL